MRSLRHSALRLLGGIATAFVVALLTASPAHAGMTDYQITTGTATYTPLANDTVLIGGTTASGATGQFNDQAIGGPVNIGFNFKFDYVTYTRFAVNSSGLLTFDGDTTSSFNDNLAGAPVYPIIAPFWQHGHMYDGGGAGAGCVMNPRIAVSYRMTGTAPNRMLTIQWSTQVTDALNSYWWAGCGAPMLQFQARLYERNSKIEFHYGSIWSSAGQPVSASIGIADTTNDFLSFTPTGGTSATVSTLAANGNIETHVTPIPAGTLYTMIPCQRNIDINGNVAQRGTATMANGDSLLVGLQVMRGNSGSNDPFSVSLGQNICAGRTYSMSLSGPAAAEYSISPTNGSLTVSDTDQVTVTFTPQGIGRRHATLTVTDDNGLSMSYNLAGTGLTRIAYTGIVPQGGTAAMANGDVLMQNITVTRFQSQSFTPFTVSNINGNVSAPAAPVTYSIVGVSGGQYSIAPPNASLGAGASSTPSVTFSPTAAGYVVDTLRVVADGEIRTFVLRGFSASPEVRYSINSSIVSLDSNTVLFPNQSTCVGEALMTVAIDIESLGNVDLVLDGSSIFRTDTLFGPGIPPFPLLRDGFGQPVAAPDYIITALPPVLPLSRNVPLTYPIVLAPNTKTSVYLTFVGQYPGKRYARTFIRSNAVNVRSAGPNGMLTSGLFKFNLLARGLGSDLATSEDGKTRNTVVFPQTHVGDSATAIFPMFNSGTCTLRVGLSSLGVTQGDDGEFEIAAMPDNLIDGVTKDLLIAPGKSDTIIFRFKPNQIGSRRAGVRLRTNDSTLGIPGITEMGYLYVDLYGIGRTDLYASDVEFGMALIGGADKDHKRGAVTMTNTRINSLNIISVTIVGDDASEFRLDPANPWPAMPFTVTPGQEIDLSVLFAPAAGGQPGGRFATLKIITSDQDTIYAQLHGVAGTRTMNVTPTLINFSPISIGRLSRRTITVTNTGTMQLHLKQPEIGPGEFSVTPFSRIDLDPGQMETIEVTYIPSNTGVTSQLFTIESDASGGPVDISLNGVALMPRKDEDGATTGAGRAEDGVGRADNLHVSGVETIDIATGMTLRQSNPNPGRDIVEIRYVITNGAQVELALYNVRGDLVRTLDAGYRESGERVVRLDVSGLPSGTYQYRLTSGGHSIARSLVVTK